jgi:hypothetical protein
MNGQIKRQTVNRNYVSISENIPTLSLSKTCYMFRLCYKISMNCKYHKFKRYQFLIQKIYHLKMTEISILQSVILAEAELIVKIFNYIFFFYGLTALYGPGPPRFVEVSWSHTLNTPQSVGLLWTRDQLFAETSIWHHTTLTRDRHPCPRWDFFFSPILVLFNPFVLHVTLRSMLPSLKQTQHKHPCPRWDSNPRS